MRELLRYFQRCGEVPLHPDELGRRIGVERVSALRALSVIIDRERPTTLPCGGFGGCQREVHERGDRERPFVAVCGADVTACESELLTEPELARRGVSTEGLARVVARALDLPDARVRRGDAPGCWELGRDAGRAMLFAPAPFARGFELLLLSQAGATTVFVPCRDRVSGVLEQRYRSGERVELRFLEDELVLVGGRVLRQSSSSPSAAISAPLTRTVLERAGERRVTDVEYAAILDGTADLVIDLTATSDGGGHPAHTRARGRRRTVSLPARQALALVELVRAAGRPLRAAELRSMREAEVRDPERLVEIARKAIDVPLGRYEWRSFHTVRGATPEAKAYAFRPPPDMTYAVVVPAA